MAAGDDDGTIKRGAEAIARDLAGPAGQIALDRIVARHLPWFDLCQERGLSWPQMASVLRAAGAGRATGLPFSHSHLSAAVWRQRQKYRARTGERTGVRMKVDAAPPRIVHRDLKSDTAGGRTSTQAKQPSGASRSETMHKGGETAIPAADVGKRTRSSTEDVKAYMKRAAHLRRSRNDD